MKTEICQHGNDITNKMSIACPEGCLSNNQRGLENRKMAAQIRDVRRNVEDIESKLKALTTQLQDLMEALSQ